MKSSGVAIKNVPGKNGGSRSYYSPYDKTLYISQRTANSLTVVHEAMHAMEDISPSFFADSEKFFSEATKGKPIKTLRQLTGNNGYTKDEFAYDMDGKCIDPYAYKIYENPGTKTPEGFEITSMGVEYLYRNPLAFVNDPNLLKFILNKIRRI